MSYRGPSLATNTSFDVGVLFGGIAAVGDAEVSGAAISAIYGSAPAI